MARKKKLVKVEIIEEEFLPELFDLELYKKMSARKLVAHADINFTIDLDIGNGKEWLRLKVTYLEYEKFEKSHGRELTARAQKNMNNLDNPETITQYKKEISDMAKTTKKTMGKASKAKAVKKAVGKAVEAKGKSTAPSERKGRKPAFDLKSKIKKLVKDNPKREGTKSYDRFKLYSKAKTVGCFLTAGGTSADLVNDTAKGFIKIG